MTEPVDLGRSQRVVAIAQRLRHHLDNLEATTTFAIVGPWGSGKTWLLDGVVAELETDGAGARERDLLRFNPWFYADESALFLGFAELLLGLTPRKSKARRAVAGLLSTVGPSLKFGSVDLTKLAARAEERVSGLSGPEQIRKRISEVVHNAGRHVLVVMDDLDRLNPTELLMLFKLIRLVGDVPGISYLLTYDEETLLQLLARTDVAADSEERARRYLEKIVEVKWVVPPMTSEQVVALVDAPIASIVAEGAALVSEVGRQDAAFDYRLAAMLRKRIRTPRAASRFVSMFREIPPRAIAELDFDDLAFALYLRAYLPKVWALIVEEHELLTGGSMYGYLLQEDASDQLKRLNERVRNALEGDSGDTEEILDLVREHFPRFDNAVRGRNDHHGDRPLRISNPAFVARYMWFDLPPGAVSEVDVRQHVHSLPDGDSSEWLRAEVRREPVLVLESMLRAAKAEPRVSKRVFDFLDGLYEAHGVDGHVDAFLGLDANIRVNARLLLGMMVGTEVDEVLNVRIIDAGLIRRLVTGELRASAYSADVHARLLAAAARLAAELEAYLEMSPSPSLEQDVVRESLLDLLRIDAVRAVALATRMVESLQWRADDVASLYVTESVGSETRRVGFNLTVLKRHWGDDFSALLAGSSTLGYPREWDAHGHPQDLVESVDSALARALASFGLLNAIDLGGRPDDFD